MPAKSAAQQKPAGAALSARCGDTPKSKRVGFGEIARERLARLGDQDDLAALLEHQAAKAVPFGLELPALVVG